MNQAHLCRIPLLLALRTHYTPSHTHRTQHRPYKQQAHEQEREGNVAAAAAEMLDFDRMNEAELRQWVDASPGRVNDRGRCGYTPLAAAAWKHTHSLVVWLLDEKGANVNATLTSGRTALHLTETLDILNALLDRGGDPIVADGYGAQPLMRHAYFGKVEVVARLLQDPRVRATINVQDRDGNTALHYVSGSEKIAAAPKVHLLLQAGANPTIPGINGLIPLKKLRQRYPTYHGAIVLLEQAPDAEKAFLLVKARCLAVAAASNIVAPSCLRSRVARGQPLPRVALMPLMDGQEEEGGEEGEGEEDSKLRTTLAFMCGVGRKGMPRDVFRVVMDLLMPSWDPLRRGVAGGGDSGGITRSSSSSSSSSSSDSDSDA